MNLSIHRRWFHEEVDAVEYHGLPARRNRRTAQGHRYGLWALYRILGRSFP